MSVSILVSRFVRWMIPPRRVEIFNPDIPIMMIQVSVVIHPTPTILRYRSSYSEYGEVLDHFSCRIVEPVWGDDVVVVLLLKYAVSIK
jgi:hypothetical protein